MEYMIQTPLMLREKSNYIRKKIIDFHNRTGKHHIGSSLSAVEILTVLYYRVMGKEDTFILSKGHGSSVLYVILNDLGIIADEDLTNLEEHPKLNLKFGISASTGSLGHGLSIGLGMAFADKENDVYVLLGDGECEEGQIWEAAAHASELGIRNLKAIVDCNGFQGFKSSDYDSLAMKFKAFSWKVVFCDGHDCMELINSLENHSESPLIILAKTIKGNGLDEVEGTLESHYFHFPE